MSEKKIKPTYIGENKSLVFINPKELFTMFSSRRVKMDSENTELLNKYVKGTIEGLQNAIKTKYGNENNTKTQTSPEFWDKFEKKAKDLGIDFLGYTPVNENFIFYKLTIYGKNVIILGMELKWDGIRTAPNVLSSIESFRVYKELGEKTIELTNYLKNQGFKSEAHHPFGGKLLYPPHAVAAGLGIKGRNGLVCTPEFGIRQRWSVITIDAVIPNTVKRNFTELENFCRDCGVCISNCFGGAAYEKPIEKVKGSGVITHIERSKCTQSLLNNNYCSFCLRVYPQGQPKN